jgi:hypothetical protein
MKLTESNLKRLILEVLEEQYGWEHSANAARKRMWELKPLVKAGQKEYEEEYRAAMWRSWEPDSTMSPEETAKQQAKDDAAEEERERRQQAIDAADVKNRMRQMQDPSLRGKMIKQMANDPIPGEEWFDKDG